jgi:hypothetical protein
MTIMNKFTAKTSFLAAAAMALGLSYNIGQQDFFGSAIFGLLLISCLVLGIVKSRPTKKNAD